MLQTDTLIGRKLSHYRVVRKIGEGGMGVVYQARDPRLERDVALKVLAAGILPGPDSRERFRREALALSRLNHPNVATVYDFDTEGEVDFLVMELIHGATLGEKLTAGPIPGVQALEIGMQIAEALEVAHSEGVIHRDLKPGNIMVTASGLAKVLDFGLARSQGIAGGTTPSGTEKRTARTRRAHAMRPSEAMGTPGYTSPEQIRGMAQDQRTDTFAFGCVLFECLAGKRAFEGETAEEVLAAVLTQDPKWAALPKGVPPRVRALLERCLEKHKSKRASGAREIREVLEAILGTRRRLSARAQTPPSFPHSLPRPGTSFIGREVEIAECRALLSSARLLLLTGPGGCGKTRLAIEIASGALADFSDGVMFVDLAPLPEGERVVQAVASAAGVREEPGTEFLETLQRSLGEKRALILLDNCEHHLKPCAEVARAILQSCPHVAILATSREALRIPGEHPFVVPPLRVPDADGALTVQSVSDVESVRLFSERAARAKAGFQILDRDVRAIAEICRRLDGIPLAIELAASRVAVLSPEEIRSKLDSRFRLLTNESLEAPARHQTLHAAIQWSYEQLTPDEQRLFSSLSVFAGGWTFESAARVCGGPDEFAVLDRFTRLLDKSLFVADAPQDGAPKYRYLETIREYALERLDAFGDGDVVRERHLDFFLSVAEEAAPKLTGPQQASWLARLDDEHENFLAALRFCERSPRFAEKALRLTAAIWRFWMARGHFGVGRAALDRALRTEGAGRSVARAETLTGGGALAFHLNDWGAGRSYCEESLEIFSAIGHAQGMAEAWVALGNLALGEADYSSARSFYDKALTKYREAGQRRGMGVALSNSGRAAELQGDLPAALRLYEDGLAFLREVGDLSSTALRLSSLGYLALRLGDPAAARERLMECIVLVQELKEQRAGHFALERSAALLEAWGEASDAAALCAAAETLRERVGSPLTPRERVERDALVGRLREDLGDSFEDAWSEGSALKFEPALDRALSCLDRSGSGKRTAPRWPERIERDQESTGALLEEIRGGNARAVARLVKRYLPILRRWAHGRLPGKARDLADTDDLVQVALIRALGQVESFEQRRTGAFLSYMRQILRNQIRDEIRRPGRKAQFVELADDLPDGGASPLEEAIGRESLDRYETALAALPKKQRDGIVMRLEMGFTYREIAEALGSPSEEAARISVRRALEQLKRRMPESNPAER